MSDHNLTFSVIMPCYNSETYVRNAVESVISQSYPNWELIAINDGSTDETLSILTDYSKTDSRIKVFSKENGGYATAINYGLERINGDYFLMMGSDDYLSEDLLSETVKYLDDKFPDMIGFRTIRVIDGYNNGLDKYTRYKSPIYVHGFSIKEFEVDYPEEAGIFSVRDTSKIYKKELLGNLKYFGKYGYDADGIFSMLFSHECHSFCVIPIDGYYWTLRSDSVSAKTNLKVDMDRMQNWNEFYNRLMNYETNDITKKEREYLVYCYQIIRSIICEPNGKISRKDVSKPLKTIIKSIKKYNAINLVFPEKRIINTVFLKMPTVWYYYKRLRVTLGG